MTRHSDEPGVIGAIGTALGESGLNITAMAVGTGEDGGEASAVIAVAEAPAEEAVQRVRELAGVREACLVQG